MGSADYGQPGDPLNAPDHSAWAAAVYGDLGELANRLAGHTHDGVGVLDHGALVGLGDDDHPQYLHYLRGGAISGDTYFTRYFQTTAPQYSHLGYLDEHSYLAHPWGAVNQVRFFPFANTLYERSDVEGVWYVDPAATEQKHLWLFSESNIAAQPDYVTVPRECIQYRITLTSFEPVSVRDFFLYWTGALNTADIGLYGYDVGLAQWVTLNETTGANAWPGFTGIPHVSKPFYPASNITKLMVVITPHWSLLPGYENEPLYLYGIAWLGSYGSHQKGLYAWNQHGQATFPDTVGGADPIGPTDFVTRGFGWQTPTLLNGWLPNATIKYRKTGANQVYVQGTVQSGASGVPIFNLPAGYKPTDTSLEYACPASGGLARVGVSVAGAITVWSYIAGGTNSWVALDFTFWADA